MRVTVRYYNIMATLAGCRQQTVDLPEGSTLLALLDDLVSGRTPELAGMIFQDRGRGGGAVRLGAYLRMFLNGRLAREADLDGSLHEGDELMLFPAIAGG